MKISPLNHLKKQDYQKEVIINNLIKERKANNLPITFSRETIETFVNNHL
ncbi:hypothetical protein GILI108418_04270 [Gillisia limnaea]|uniref:Uncharacterized protein n=1 Tax=Gillisia limnaea (strain DSM 15749 / LMG 21470 / R-8282) TaxID=865937 RepID=H2BVB4_GILLR|nr:hypothetical protein Gilli_1105 [Gillisia limnaea DSM 15749]